MFGGSTGRLEHRMPALRQAAGVSRHLFMFKLFSKNEGNSCPIDVETRLWMEDAFMWLVNQFGIESIKSKSLLLPRPEDFPIQFDGSIDSMIKTAEILAGQMEISMNDVSLDTYEEGIHELGTGILDSIFTEIDPNSKEELTSGLYFDKNELGKFDILIEKRNLTDPENLIATLAHEFSHIKLMGEKRIESNDESLTDLSTVVFGLGIFNANTAFRDYKNFHSWGHNSVGYLKQREWGYALALYAYFRSEHNPEWIKYLTPNIKLDFQKSLGFICLNTDKIFKEDYQGGG
jgi:hypothetical protein